MTQRLVLILLCGIGFNLYAQVQINRGFEFKYKPPEKYFDLSQSEVGKITFFEKSKKDYIHFVSYEYQDTLYFQLQLSYYFAKLTDHKKKLLFNYLARDHKVDTSKIMIIHYADSLKSIKNFPKADTVLNGPGATHKHLYSHQAFVDQNRNCIKKYNKNKHSNVYHFVKTNKDHPLEIADAKWYIDKRESLYSIFNKTIKTFLIAIIHPDGRYFVYNYYEDPEVVVMQNRLVKNKKWDTYYKKFQKRFKL